MIPKSLENLEREAAFAEGFDFEDPAGRQWRYEIERRLQALIAREVGA